MNVSLKFLEDCRLVFSSESTNLIPLEIPLVIRRKLLSTDFTEEFL